MRTVGWPQILLAHHLKCCDREQKLFVKGVQLLSTPYTVLLSSLDGVGFVLQPKIGGDLLISKAFNLLDFILEMLPYPALLKIFFFK